MQKYYPLGQVSYSFLPNDNESFNKIVEWREKVGDSALNFIFEDEMLLKIRKIIELSCGDWYVYSNLIREYRPDPAMVMRGILEDKKFKTILIGIQKGTKQISFYITPSKESWSFVTTYFVYKVPNESFFRPYNDGEFRCWSAFFCDMEFDDSLESLVSELCDWYDKQDVIEYNNKYY